MKKFDVNSTRGLITVAAVSMITLLSACGGSSTTTPPDPSLTTSNVVPQNPNPYPTYPYPNPTTTPIGGGGTSGTPPSPFQFSITGAGGAYPTYSTGNIATTDNILQVRVTAAMGSAIAIPGYSNFQTKYGCASYTVTAMGRSMTTGILAVPGGDNSLCPSSPSNQILDFSGYLSSGSLNNVNVGVTSAQYDLYCQEFWSYYEQYYPIYGSYWSYYSPMGGNSGYYCTLHTEYKTHVINGTLEVRTNQTANFQ